MPLHFDSCQFGPYELRAFLRRRLMAGEQVVGWGVVSREMSVFDTMMLVAAAMVPAAGTVLQAAIMSRTKRFMILTDTRLLMLLPDAKGCAPNGDGITFDTPHHSLTVARTSRARTFRVMGPGWVSAEPYKLPGGKKGAHKRLHAGLDVLAADSDRVAELLAG